MVKGKIALPIPPTFFEFLQGFEDFLDNFEPERLFQWIAEANPLIAAAIMDQGKDGADYMVRFKQFVIDSVKALEPQEEPLEEPATDEATPEPAGKTEESSVTKQPPAKPQVKPGHKLLTCDKCKEPFTVTDEEAKNIKECPLCGEPA